MKNVGLLVHSIKALFDSLLENAHVILSNDVVSNSQLVDSKEQSSREPRVSTEAVRHSSSTISQLWYLLDESSQLSTPLEARSSHEGNSGSGSMLGAPSFVRLFRGRSLGFAPLTFDHKKLSLQQENQYWIPVDCYFCYDHRNITLLTIVRSEFGIFAAYKCLSRGSGTAIFAGDP